MASPAYQDSGAAASGTSTTPTLNKPTNLAVGDTMVAYFIVGTSLTTTVSAVPSGWTPVTGSSGTAGRQPALTTDNEVAFCYTRVADEADVAASNFQWTISASLPWHSPGILRITGSNGTVNISSSLGNTGATNHPIPSITTTVAETLLLGFWGMGSGSATWTLPGSMTSVYNASLLSLPVAVGREDMATAAATGTRTATSSSGQGSADFLLALEPGATGPTDPALNASFAVPLDAEFALRTDIQETGGGTGEDVQLELRAQKNNAGGYQQITTSSAGLRIVATTRFGDADPTTDLLSGGTGSFVTGQGDEDGTTGVISLTPGANTEVEWSLEIDSAGAIAGDYWDVRVYRAGGAALESYTVTPRITAAAATGSPTIGLSPTALTFNASEGGANPASKNLVVSNTGGGTLSFSVSDDAAWLNVAPGSGNAPQTLVVSVETGALTQAGSPYTGTITITDPESTNSPQTVVVTFTVGPPSSFPVDVGGTWGETNNYVAPILAPNGALYVVNEAQNDPPVPAMRKSTDGGVTWTEMNARTSGTQDMESIHAELVGDDIVVAWQRSGYYGYFNVFDTTTDTWTNVTEAFRSSSSPSGDAWSGIDQVTSLVRRSDGSYVLLVAGSDTTAGALSYKTRSSGGAWSADNAEVILDAEAGKDWGGGWIKKSAQGDGVHIIYNSFTDGILYHRFLSDAGALSARTSVATGLSTGSGASALRKPYPNQALRIWNNAGTDRMYVVYRKSDGRLYGRQLDGNGGTPTVGSEEAISTGFVGQNPDGLISYQSVGAVAHDPATNEIHVLWADGPTATSNYPNPAVDGQNTMRLRVRSAAGTWGSISSPHNTEPIGAIAAEVLTISSVKQLAVFYDEYTAIDPGLSKYTRFLITSGQVVNGGVASESNAAPASARMITGGVATESDSATVGVAGVQQRVFGGVATENDSATVSTSVNPATIAGQRGLESDSAPAGTVAQQLRVFGGVAGESDSAPAGTRVNTATIQGGVAAESDSAPAGTRSNPATIAGGRGLENDAAPAGSAAQHLRAFGGVASENDSTPAGTRSNPTTVAAGVASESDAALAGTRVNPATISGSVAAESDSAPVGTRSNPATIAAGVALEADSVPTATTGNQQVVSGGVAAESDTALVGTRSNPATIAAGRALENDSANAGTTGNAQSVSGGVAREDDSSPGPTLSTWPVIAPLIFSEMGYSPAGSLARALVVSAGVASEGDSVPAGSTSGLNVVQGGVAAEGDAAPAGTRSNPAVIAAGVAQESDAAPAGTRSNPTVIIGGRAIEANTSVTGFVQTQQVVAGGVAAESDRAPTGGVLRFALPKIDLPTFVTLDPRTTTATLRPAPVTAVAIERVEASAAVEKYETTNVMDSSTATSALVVAQATTISVENTESDVKIDPTAASVELDASQNGALIDA
jgi:hypothetical protein